MKFAWISWKRDRWVLLFFLAFYVGFAFFAAHIQERLVYVPGEQDFETCPYMRDAERVTFEGTRMYYKEAGGVIAVVYHGNAGSACDRDYYADMFEKNGLSYLIIEYAGYSNDTARSPSHALLKRDVEHAVAFLQLKTFDKTVVVGESIGVGFASYHAQLAPPEKILLISAFSDILSAAREEYWFYPSFMLSLLVDNSLDNVRALANYRGEVLIVHGREDDIFPLHFGKGLYDALQTPYKNMTVIAGAGHNDIFGYPATYAAIEDFLK